MWENFMVRFARTQPDKRALLDRLTGLSWSYQQLAQEIDRRAGQLCAHGVGAGDRIVWVATSCLEHLTLFFAAIRLGAILVPLNPRLAPQEMAEICQDVAPRLLLGSAIPPLLHTHPSYRDWQNLGEVAPLPAEAPIPDTQILMILYTSGSTGRPKGVMLHAGMILANMQATVATDVLRPDDITLINTPFFHTGGYHVFTLPLFSIGGTLILHEKFDPGLVLQEIHTAGVTVFWAVPTMFQAIHDHPDFVHTDLRAIRFFLSGGAPLPLALIQSYHQRGVPFKQGFGLTEVGPNCFLLETHAAFDHPDSIGKPMPHCQARIVDEQGQPVAANQVGELWLRGAHRCAGYWHQEELFTASLRGDYFVTGDLVRCDDEGYFYVVGRKKEMYISGGENVYPGEVEKILNRHPDIGLAVVVAVNHPKWHEVGLAFYTATRTFTLAEMRGYLDPLLARFKHPHHLIQLSEMPLLANGKIDRPQLKKRASEAGFLIEAQQEPGIK
ncbi:MAG: AMP-binding protein [Magnetococcales bacterium]|nr:AMP-binding protein [Magnetococcales bacterium]MBF0116183.1 AMP-binding protein [Magnetococcales bacterium]